MQPNVKFCGITRAADATAGVDAGARYLGLVLAPSPRQVTVPEASALVTLLRGAPVQWVGVFARADLATIAPAVANVGLDVVQLHVPVSASFVHDVTRETGARVWCVGQVEGDEIRGVDDDAGEVEAVLFDTSRGGQSGGLGVTFDWRRARAAIEGWRGRVRVGVAGGLTPENVSEAVRVLSPDIVDVSSGIEAAPGIKDHQRMRAFVNRARSGGGGGP